MLLTTKIVYAVSFIPQKEGECEFPYQDGDTIRDESVRPLSPDGSRLRGSEPSARNFIVEYSVKEVPQGQRLFLYLDDTPIAYTLISYLREGDRVIFRSRGVGKLSLKNI
jgi:hypothetical protein